MSTKRKLDTTEADAIALKTSDAYSVDRYGPGAWRECCRALAERGYNAKEIEEVMRSKYTRWAADHAETDSPTAKDLLAYLDKPGNQFNIKELMGEREAVRARVQKLTDLEALFLPLTATVVRPHNTKVNGEYVEFSLTLYGSESDVRRWAEQLKEEKS